MDFVGGAGAVVEVWIGLGCGEAQTVSADWSVAEEAFGAARIMPNLRAHIAESIVN